jgi:ribosomal protein S1
MHAMILSQDKENDHVKLSIKEFESYPSNMLHC